MSSYQRFTPIRGWVEQLLFVNPALTTTGFDARFDVSSLEGAYTVTIVAERGASSWQCKLTQDLIIIGPGRTTP
jgi:hypothetical protein